MRRTGVCILSLTIALATNPQPAFADARSPLLRDSFPIGSSDGALYQVQDLSIATERLINGLFRKAEGRSIDGALRRSRHDLMNDAIISHPFYWAGFALIGDGGRLCLPSSADSPANGGASAPTTKTALK